MDCNNNSFCKPTDGALVPEVNPRVEATSVVDVAGGGERGATVPLPLPVADASEAVKVQTLSLLRGSKDATAGGSDAALAVDVPSTPSTSTTASNAKRLKRQRQKMRRNLERLSLEKPSTSSGSAAGTGEVSVGSSSSRKRSHGSTPGSTSRPPPKKPCTGLSFSQVTKKDLTVYVGPNLGEDPITPDEFKTVKKNLNKRILDRIRSGEGAICVEACTHYSGRVRIACADEASLNWIREEARKLVPEPSIRKGFWVMGPGDLPPTRKCTAWVPVDLAESKGDLLDLLGGSNRDLNMRGLHLVGESNRSMSTGGEGRVCIFAVEPDTFKQLEALQMRPYCGMGRIAFRAKPSASDAPADDVESDKNTVAPVAPAADASVTPLA